MSERKFNKRKALRRLQLRIDETAKAVLGVCIETPNGWLLFYSELAAGAMVQRVSFWTSDEHEPEWDNLV
jgi:hypothetical protein